MITCPHCQKELPVNYSAAYCPFCGEMLPDEKIPASPVQTLSFDEIAEQKERRRKALLATYSICLALLPSVIGLLMVKNKQHGDVFIISNAILSYLASVCFLSIFSHNVIVRFLGGVFLAGLIFLLNFAIAVLIGCSHMGKIAP